jgi:hypothetical protein
VAVGFPALCVARPSGSGWEALCLDFDIGVQGQSFVDVQCKLEDMVTSYIEDALQEEELIGLGYCIDVRPLVCGCFGACEFFLQLFLGGGMVSVHRLLSFPFSAPPEMHIR